MRGSVKGMALALLRVRLRWSVSTSFVRLGAPRRHLGRAAGEQRLRGPWAVALAVVAVASGMRVREVADPKGRCPGTGRPRWIEETPRGALPGSLVPDRQRRRPAAGRPRRTGAGAGSASLPSRSCLRRACAGSRPGPRCRSGAGQSRPYRGRGRAAVPGARQPVPQMLAAGGVDAVPAGQPGACPFDQGGELLVRGLLVRVVPCHATFALSGSAWETRQCGHRHLSQT